jgi:hypothetical protein
MTACCKRESNETIRDGAENSVKYARSDTDTEARCSGEICDGMGFQFPLHIKTTTDKLIKKNAYRLPLPSSVELLATRN